MTACNALIASLEKQQAKCEEETVWVDSMHHRDTLPNRLPASATATPDCDENPIFALGAALRGRGEIYLQEKQYALAITDLNELVLLMPHDRGVFYARGKALEAQGKYGSAAQDFTRAIRLEPTRPAGWIARCRDRGVMGSSFRALKDCGKALALQPDNAEALSSRALIYLREKKFAVALSAFAEALSHNQAAAEALYGRASAELALGNKIDSDADQAAALVIDPNIADEFRRYKLPVLTSH